VSGGAADTAKVAQSLAADSPDWTKIMRKDQDERTEFSLSIGKDLTIGDIKVSYDSANCALALTRVSDSTKLASLYATGGLTAYGAGSGTSGGGTSYDRLDKWSDYTTDKATYILSALLGDDLNTRLSAVESSALTSVDWSIIANKPSTYTPAPHTHSFQSLTGIPTTLSGYGITDAALASHTHTFASLTSKPTTLAGYSITDANISAGVITLGANSITPLTAHQDISGKSDITHTHTVSINGTVKTIAATGGAAVDLGTYLTSHQPLTDYMTIEQTGIFVDGKIDALDVAAVGGAGSYIQSILETDGKISAVAATLPTKLSQFTNDPGFITAAGTTTGNVLHTNGYDAAPDDVGTWINMSSKAGMPSGSWGHIINMCWGRDATTWTSQIGIDVQTASGIYWRSQANAAGNNIKNYPWIKILDSTNYSSYALPLSGGKMTGNLDTVQNGGSWVHAMQFNAIMYNGLGVGTGYNSWEAFLGIKTNSGNIVSYGSIYDQVGFALYLNGRTDNGTDGYTYLDTTTGIWHFDHSISGNISGNAATASQLLNNYGAHMTFNWIGESGQPSWLWGGEDGSNMYVYNPSNFNVNSAVKLATARSLWGQNFDGTGNVDGLLSIRNAGGGNYNENVRLHASTGDSWTSLTFCGTDNTGDSGTSLSTWLIGTYQSNIYINRNGSNNHTGCELCNVGSNWGVGTLSPQYKLDVAGPGRFQGDLIIGNTIIHASGSNGGINSIQPADDYIIGDCNIGGTMGLKSLNSYSAGIGFYGQDGGSYGTLTASGSGLTWTGNILATGGVTAYTSSDRRLKKNIRHIDSLGVIRSLGGTYQFDYRKDNKHSIGFIAQNVRKSALSDMVCESAGYLRINYLDTRLISLALGASVELDDEVTRLKKRVSELEKEVERLKAA
jgi:hypothetical protein